MSLRGPGQDLHDEARRAEFKDGMDGMGWMDGISKVSFNFLYTLCVRRSSIYPQSMKKIKGHFWYSVPSHQIPHPQFTSEFNKKLKKTFFKFFLANTYPIPNLRLNSIKTKRKVTSLEPNFFQFWIGKNVFEIKKKWLMQRKTKRKKMTFETKYLKTHVYRVFSKIMFPHPQLDTKLWNP